MFKYRLTNNTEWDYQMPDNARLMVKDKDSAVLGAYAVDGDGRD
jgi:hypothetical protein